VVQLLSHFPAVVSPGRGRIARPGGDRGGLRPCGPVLSLLLGCAAPRGSQHVTQSHCPHHLSEVPLAEAGLAIRLTVDPCGETLLVIDVSELERSRGAAHRRDQGDC
jgi:hypothetical protein